jgi:hypothetical protein
MEAREVTIMKIQSRAEGDALFENAHRKISR